MTVPSTSQIKTEPRAGAARRFPPVTEGTARVSVPYAADGHAADIAQYRREMTDAFVAVGDNHYRVQVKEPSGVGRYEFCGLADGLFVRFAETNYPEPQSACFRSPDSLHIYLASSGDGEYTPPNGLPLSFEAPSAVLIIEPADEPAAELTLAGFTRYIYIVLHRDVLKTLYSGNVDELPALLQAFLEGDVQHTSGWALPLSAALLRCLEDVQACSLSGHRRRLFLQSKTVEIVCQALEAFDKSDCFRAIQPTKHRARGVLKAQHFLEECFVSPPSLEDLAAEVGLSRSALSTGFRQILGQSVYEHIRDLRMQKALALLSESDDPIIQIAYAVGYNRPSSFSAAVQRHFGASPTKLRRKSRSSSV